MGSLDNPAGGCRRLAPWLVAGVLGVGSIGVAFGAVIRIPADQPTIQAGIDAAVRGDIVLVSPGTYRENLDFSGKAITVRSVFPDSLAVVRRTVVWPEAGGSVVRFSSAEDHSSVLSGLTLTGGTGDITRRGPHGGESRAGGGVWCSGSSPMIKHCILCANIVPAEPPLWPEESQGGGLWCSAGAEPIIQNCSIIANEAAEGGGLLCKDHASAQIEDSVFLHNRAVQLGGGMYLWNTGTTAMSECHLEGNQAPGGGGIYAGYLATLHIRHCTVIGNHGEGHGAGIACRAAREGFPLIENSLIIGNDAGNHAGGGIYCSSSTPRIRNTLITENSAGSGAAVACWEEGALALIENCTLTHNQATSSGGAIDCRRYASADVRNSILWNNEPDEIYPGVTGVSVAYSNIAGGWEGSGNIDADPLFRSRHGFEYLLGIASPCIDAGDPVIQDGISDWHPKWPQWYPNAPRSDMGAYGGPGNLGWVPYIISGELPRQQVSRAADGNSTATGTTGSR